MCSSDLAANGARVAFASRFLPGTRVVSYVTAGVLRVPVLAFSGWLFLASIAWVTLAVTLVSGLGSVANGVVGTAIALVVGWFALRLLASASTGEGRRQLVGLWRRWTMWEFWPQWLFYPPVLLYGIALALRHRSATLFTAANPGIPDGGVIGESKWDI